MSYILNVATAVPDYKIEQREMLEFYLNALPDIKQEIAAKLGSLIKKTKINTRYSCIPDFKGIASELFINNNYNPSVEDRIAVYKSKVIPLGSKVIGQILKDSQVACKDITHFITVSCTGVMAPGLELTLAKEFNLEHTEKSAVNFLGCYAALKALKHANYIAKAQPDACILVVCVELCSLHFSASELPDDIVSNVLFSDGAAAVMVCGQTNRYIQNQIVMSIDKVGSAFVPDSAELMKWDISSNAFKMILSPRVVPSIKEKIFAVVDQFLQQKHSDTDYYAIHPGGIKIIEAVKESLGLTDKNISESMTVMENFGNMSSPTILFVLKNIFDKIKSSYSGREKTIFACAFGPGLNIEMIGLTAKIFDIKSNYNVLSKNEEEVVLSNGI